MKLKVWPNKPCGLCEYARIESDVKGTVAGLIMIYCRNWFMYQPADLVERHAIFSDCWENKEPKLLPCPFCGNDEIAWREVGKNYKAFCISCGGTGPYFTDRRSAAEKWNERKSKFKGQTNCDCE